MPETGDDQSRVEKPTEAALQARFDQAMVLYRQGNLADAERCYGEVLQQQPDHFSALHLLGVIACQTRRTERGIELIERAIGFNPTVAEAHNNLGNALRDLKRPMEALASYDKALALKRDFAEAHNNRGNALMDLKRHDEAITSYDNAIALNPEYANAYNNRGTALKDLKRPEAAIASYDKAIALKPDFAEAHNNRGNALKDLRRPEAAIASYDKAIVFKPNYAEAYNNRGNALTDLKRHEEAIVSYDKAIALKTNYAEAHYNRGNALKDLKCLAEALASYDKAIALNTDYANAYNNRGNTLNALKRYEEALTSYDKALELKPDIEFLYGNLIYMMAKICDWSNLETKIVQLIHKIDGAEKVSHPFPLLSTTYSPELQRKAAETYTLASHPLDTAALPKIAKRQRRNKIRIAYVSSDFRQHPTSYLIAGLIEALDRDRFDVIGISLRSEDPSELGQRIKRAFNKFIDVSRMTDQSVVQLMRELEVDIAIDLMGYTQGNRTSIFAQRAAPVQVNYLGYPGTTGAEYIDYLIADPTLIPASYQKYFSEKIVYLPNSYQANDRKRRIAEKTSFTRAEASLPEDAFVFCCFNNNYKIIPDVFDCWMSILKQVDGSVLWLLEDNTKATSNLRKEAEIRGVNSERLIFANRVPPVDHLARHRLAGLFLDTLPCNAHTTASDALWAGLPVLTRVGETFASRVAASLLNAIGLTELITSTPQAYEALAIELATHPEKLAAIKSKLATNRLTTALFDTQMYTRHIEAAYKMMYERYQADLPPDHIYVPQYGVQSRRTAEAV